jgi:3-oxoacyl-[acyl-carrier protein] reductase
MDLKNKVALVTGGTRGIGQSISLTLAKYGCDIILNYASNEDSAKETVEKITNLGRKAISYKADVSKIEQIDNMVDNALKEFGKIDILINNAGFNKDNFLILMPQADWYSVIETNLTGTFNCCKIVAKNMISNRYGKIINVSSISGLMGLPGQVNYSASKAGVIGLTKTLAQELARFNILVNAVAPGLIETEMIKNIPQKHLDSMLKNIPLKRTGTCEEVSEVVAFLASDKSSYITGQVLTISGGL